MNNTKRLFLSFIVSIICCNITLANATGLPPEHESKRLMLAAQKAIDAQQWDKAEQQLKSVTGLNVPLSAKFHYMYGQVLYHKSEFDMAQKSLEVYVLQAGSEGEYYLNALELITEAEESKVIEVELPQKTEAPTFKLDKAKDEYVASLKKLYLTSDPKKALILQINSILSSNPYVGDRIKKMDAKKGIRYSISYIDTEIQVQEKRYSKDGLPTLIVNKMDVSGIDPFIKYECDYDRYVCWLYSPVTQYERWILIDRDEAVAKELSGALGRLIKLLQGVG